MGNIEAIFGLSSKILFTKIVGEKMFTLDVHPLGDNVHPQTLRISLAIGVRRWKNVSVARSAPKPRREPAV